MRGNAAAEGPGAHLSHVHVQLQALQHPWDLLPVNDEHKGLWGRGGGLDGQPTARPRGGVLWYYSV